MARKRDKIYGQIYEVYQDIVRSKLKGGNGMKTRNTRQRFLSRVGGFLLLLLFLLGVSVTATTLTVAIPMGSQIEWSAVVERYVEAHPTVDVQLLWFPPGDLIMHIEADYGRARDRFDLVMIHREWLNHLAYPLQDLSGSGGKLEIAGGVPVLCDGKVLGGEWPSNSDWVVCVSKQTKNLDHAVRLFLTATQGTTLSLRFLTQNVQLLPQDVPYLPSLSLAIDERVPCIINLISGYHIIGLQEVFDADSQDRIIKAWYNKLVKTTKWISLKKAILEQKKDLAQLKARGVIDARPNKEEAQIVYDEYFVMGPDQKDDPSQDGGLAILSTYPIIAASGFVYTKSLGLDSLANKGALYARINLAPASKREDCYIHVFVTHAQATRKNDPAGCAQVRKAQFKELRQFIQNATADKDGGYDGYPIVLMGDFNVIADKAANSEYRAMLGELRGLSDVWDKLNPQLPGHTLIGTNQKTRFPSPWGNLGNTLAMEPDMPQRIDYFFYYYGNRLMLDPKSIELVPSKQGTLYCFDKQNVSPTTCRTIPPQVGCKLKSYTVSDHLGLQMTCEVTFPEP